MWRVALVGLLATGATSCGKKTDDGPAIVAGAPVGTVVEIEGTVTANGKPLAKGDAIAADDLVETSNVGRIAIELAHNHARWILGGNKHEKARDSKAWRLAKAEGSAAAVDQIATSAGRDGERRAADTDVTTSAPAPASDTAPAPTRAPIAPTTPPVAAAPADRPTPPKAPAVAPKPMAHTPAPGGAPPPMQPAPQLQPDDGIVAQERVESPMAHARRVLGQSPALKGCVKVATTAHLVVDCTEADGCKLTSVDANGDRECMRKVIGALVLPKATYTVEVDLTGRAR